MQGISQLSGRVPASFARRVRRHTLLALLVAFALLCAVRAAAGDVQPGTLRQQAANARAREQSLSGEIAGLGRAAGGLERQIGVLERRGAQVEGDLSVDRAKLAAIQTRLRAERERLARLRARLAQVRKTLADRLVAAYKAPKADVTTVVLTAASLSDLLERTRYLRDVERQDRSILKIVRAARGDAALQSRRLAGDERQQRGAVLTLRARARALAAMRAAAARRRATLVRIRAARASALQATRANRQHIEARLAAVERQLAAQAAASSSGPGGPWAIPWPIVECESGGQNLPPNGAGASGYYQILPSTWRGAGGSGPAAYMASKGEQDRVAASLWAGGRGASNWVCAGLVG